MVKKTNKKIEFSKLIFWLILFINIYVIALSTYAIIRSGDVSILAYLIPSTFAELATATGFYYWKARMENKLKLMKMYNINISNEDFNSQ